MGSISKPKPVVLFTAISSADEKAIRWGREALEDRWGPIELQSSIFNFDQTKFYQKQMGDDLRKQFVAFKNLVDPAFIVDAKLFSNQLEQEYREIAATELNRPINIDPGYVTEAKLVLATTKDRDHRIYLDRGILAEITSYYQGHHWQTSRWTYPDYNTPLCHQFLTQCRDYLRKHMYDD